MHKIHRLLYLPVHIIIGNAMVLALRDNECSSQSDKTDDADC